MDPPQREHDIFKDTPVRLLGYANEVGEALRGFIGTKWVRFSYQVATLYVVADTLDKTAKSLSRGKDTVTKTVFVTTDTLIWQMLASVIIPGFTINRVCAFTDYVLIRTKMPVTNRMVVVTGAGLAVIPFIIKPIDRLVDYLLDRSFRKLQP
ncbi:hypothetical protein Zmor_016701 [Zophobas morio]|uniref:Mitochondrial fission process protein 1 n=1 Tax=Zophobas morio TaxID=2755281 RepID=A0AA38I7V1_9CUCU|nr:hypothetical protein Zmor_016701 [Zophobas morio]